MYLVNFSLLISIQKRIIFSVCVRLKIVKDLTAKAPLTSIYRKSFLLSDEEKILLPFYIKYSLLPSVVFSFLNSDFMSSSFFSLYDKCLESLWYVSVYSRLEYNSDRNSFGFRPYRRSEDVFLHIKNIFSRKFIPYLVLSLKLKVYLTLGLNARNWFLNSFLTNKRLLKTWLKRVLYISYSRMYLEVFNENNLIFISALKYSLNGLV